MLCWRRAGHLEVGGSGAHLSQIIEIVREDLPILFLYKSVIPVAFRDYLKGHDVGASTWFGYYGGRNEKSLAGEIRRTPHHPRSYYPCPRQCQNFIELQDFTQRAERLADVKRLFSLQYSTRYHIHPAGLLSGTRHEQKEPDPSGHDRLHHLGYMPWYNFSAVLKFLSDEFQLTASDTGWILAAFQAGYVIVVGATGWLGDRMSLKKIVFWAMLTTGSLQYYLPGGRRERRA